MTRIKQTSRRRFLCHLPIFFLPKAMLDNTIALAADGSQEGIAENIHCPRRVLHFVTRKLAIDDAKRLVRKARDAGFDTVIGAVGWKGSTALRSMPWVRPGRDVWSAQMLREFSEYVRSCNLEFIPELPLLSKADVLFLGERPEFLFNASTYDPRNHRVYDVIYRIIEEVVSLTQAEALHIGHDEVWGWKPKDYEKNRLRAGEAMLPAELFVEDVARLHEFLSHANVQTWMWGDMLVSNEEFPHLTAHGSLHRGIEEYGYGRHTRAHISRAIVICDWQYRNRSKEFSTLATFVREGFSTLGATFEDMTVARNFAAYAAREQASGMIATTWYHVQRKDWATVDRLIAESGGIFAEMVEARCK